VKEKTDSLESKLNECEGEESLYCHNLETTLSCSADHCLKFVEEVLQWSSDVFSGSVIFDPAAEQLWKASLENFYQRGTRLLSNGYAASGEHGCSTMSGANKLRIALFEMQKLMYSWVAPTLAVGPSSRQQYATDPAKIEEGKRKLASLPLLPSDWKPYNKQQDLMIQRVKR
jgi:hypothetical protein